MSRFKVGDLVRVQEKCQQEEGQVNEVLSIFKDNGGNSFHVLRSIDDDRLRICMYEECELTLVKDAIKAGSKVLYRNNPTVYVAVERFHLPDINENYWRLKLHHKEVAVISLCNEKDLTLFK